MPKPDCMPKPKLEKKSKEKLLLNEEAAREQYAEMVTNLTNHAIKHHRADILAAMFVEAAANVFGVYFAHRPQQRAQLLQAASDAYLYLLGKNIQEHMHMCDSDHHMPSAVVDRMLSEGGMYG